MWQDLVRLLASDDDDQLKRALLFLKTEIVNGQFQHASMPKVVDSLRKLVMADNASPYWKTAVSILLAVETAFIDQRHASRSPLADWLWRPFRMKSAVLRVRDTERLRDEDAVIELARHLSSGEYPNTIFLRLPGDRARWAAEVASLRAVCLVGRPGMFDLGIFDPNVLEPKHTRFHFPDRRRPDDLRAGQLDPDRYHRVRERTTSGKEADMYKTREEEGERIDYGLVQSYLQQFGNKKLLVIVCAGCTTLGTIGAVRWAVDLDSCTIPLPTLPESEYACEALLEVKARTAEPATSWQPTSPTRILKFIIADQQWNMDNNAWHPRPPDEIGLEYSGGQPKAIHFDGEKQQFHSGRQPFNYLCALCDLSLRNDGLPIPLSTLREHRLIKEELDSYRTNEPKTFASLKQRLGSGLCIQGDSIQLLIPVRAV